MSDVVKPGQAPCDRDGCTNKATHAYFRCLNHPMPAAPIEKAQPEHTCEAVHWVAAFPGESAPSSSVSDVLELANKLRIARNALGEIRHRSLTIAHARQVALESLELMATEKGGSVT